MMAQSFGRILLSVLLLTLMFAPSRPAKVLIYPFGHCVNSHLLNAERLGAILLRHGHDVDLLVSSAYDSYTHRSAKSATSAELRPQRQLNVLQFPAPSNYTPVCEYDTMDFMLYTSIRSRFDKLIHTCSLYCDALLSSESLMRDLKLTGYDLLVVEALDPCGRILADYLDDVPFMPLITAGLGHWDGNPRPASYLPATIAPYTSEMSFFQRLGNLLMKTAYESIPVILGFDAHFEKMKAKHSLNVSTSLSNTFSRAALKLVNSDFAIDYPAPIEPDTVMIGGFAVDKDPAPLSDDLLTFIESSGEHGVIVMSFGTLTKSFDLAWTRRFVQAFLRLPQKVIWRYHQSTEGPNPLTELNVTSGDKIMFLNWLPQAALLKHPKTRLFVTHCGLNSKFEATYFGVPVVAVPLSGDQMQHAAKLTQHLQMGVSVDVFTMTQETLYKALETVLGNPKYRVNAQMVSQRLLDQPMELSSKIAYWVDYVIRHKGAPHLKSRAHHLNWFQYNSLDVLLFLGACVLTVVVLVLLIVCFLARFLRNTLLPRLKLKIE